MPKQNTRRLSQAAILTASALLLCGCRTRDAAPVAPRLPAAFLVIKPGETVTYTAPTNCNYAVITTDKGLLYLQGVEDY